MTVNGRVALVTGASSGIGKAVALQLAAGGATVAVADINTDQLHKTVNEINALGGVSMAIICDVSKKAECEAMVKSTINAYGHLDILVHCAGILIDCSLKKLTEETFDKVHRINLKGSLFCVQAVMEAMKEQQYGRVVLLSSGAYLGNAGQTAYSTAKAGVVALTKVAAKELAKYNITVNSIAPGMVQTPMTAGMPQEAYDAICMKIPLGRIGLPEDVAHFVMAFVADEAGYVTGQVLLIDGGTRS